MTRLLSAALVTTVSLTGLGCGIKLEQLPAVEYPYVFEMEFFKEVRNDNGKARKKKFKQDRVTSPFYYFLKIKEIENSGTVTVRFYSVNTAQDNQSPVKKVEKKFAFGETGNYYEYIIFFDQVEGLQPGVHRYGIFINQHLLYEGSLEIFSTL